MKIDRSWILPGILALIVFLGVKAYEMANAPTTAERVLFEYDQSSALIHYRMRTGLPLKEANNRMMESCYPQVREYYRHHPEKRPLK